MNQNYQKQLDAIIEKGAGGRLLLHCCCAPCSSYVLEYLSRHFDITAYFYNPNITDRAEYDHRAAELVRLCRELPTERPVTAIVGKHEPERFLTAARGAENEPEGGERCRRCFALRLAESSRMAGELWCDLVTTTLTISPLKHAPTINTVGEGCAKSAGTVWLPSDFKKREGYKRSIELSRQYGLYRQNYCGCEFSRRSAL